MRLKETILMLCLVLSGTLSFVYGETKSEERIDGVGIGIYDAIHNTGINRSNSIIPTLNGHVLTVVFTENLGQVNVEVATTSGASVQCLSVLTPNGLQIYIPNAGNYIVTFTLPNGDEYYGEFTVTD